MWWLQPHRIVDEMASNILFEYVQIWTKKHLLTILFSKSAAQVTVLYFPTQLHVLSYLYHIYHIYIHGTHLHFLPPFSTKRSEGKQPTTPATLQVRSLTFYIASQSPPFDSPMRRLVRTTPSNNSVLDRKKKTVQHLSTKNACIFSFKQIWAVYLPHTSPCGGWHIEQNKLNAFKRLHAVPWAATASHFRRKRTKDHKGPQHTATKTHKTQRGC